MGKAIKLVVIVAVIVAAAILAYSIVLAPIFKRGWTG